jgi:hypothetical protein
MSARGTAFVLLPLGVLDRLGAANVATPAYP